MTTETTKKIVNLHLCFDTVIPVPEKAKAMRLERYADVALRNVEATVRVSVPKELLDSEDIKVPKERKGLLGSFEILMNAALPDETISIELTRDDYAKLDLLKVEFDRASMPGMVLVKIELPLPAAIVEKQINLPRNYMGTVCSQAAPCVLVNNVVGTNPPHQGAGRQNKYRGKNVATGPMNHQLKQVNGYWFDYWVNRPEDPEDAEPGTVVKYSDTYFWPAECRLSVQVSNDMLVDPKDLVAEENGQLTHKHPALMGAHPNLLQSIWDGYFRIYMVPEIVPVVRGKGQREFFTTRFADMVTALDSNRISAMLPGSGHFQPRELAAYDFYCCNGANDPNSGSIYMTSACFGRTQPIYRTQYEYGKRQPVIRDGEKVLNNQVGHLVILSDLTAHQVEGALFEAMVNGDMDAFYQKHGLIFPDEAFAGDDETARQIENSKRDKQAKAGKPETESKPVSKPSPEPEPEPEPEPKKEQVAFGDNSDLVPPGPEEEEDPGQEIEEEDESESEDSEEDSDPIEDPDIPMG